MSAVEFELTAAQDRATDMLVSDAVHCCLGGGSRSGKTFMLVRAVLMRALRAPNSRHVIFRFRFNAIKASIVYDTLPKVMALCFPGLMDKSDLNKTDWFLTLPNGSEVWFGGLDDKERTEKILGQEFATIYFNECSQIPWASRVLAISRLAQQTEQLKLKAYYDLNPSWKSHWTYRMFIEKKDPENKQPFRQSYKYGYYQINPDDNRANLAPEYIEMLEDLPERARKRFLYGQYADASEGSLWTEELLAQNRVLGQEGSLPDWLRVVVAVDPSGCSGPEDKRSDEIGISVVALGTDGHGYLLEDLSGKYSPEDWAQIVESAYERHSADRIVGEKNYGGDMVRAVIQARNAALPYLDVTASRGKVIRAEPIAALYEQHKIHHVGYFPELEDQLCAFTMAGYQGLTSPDRADSCLAASTIVTTDRGYIPIVDVRQGDKVLTREGFYPVSWTGQTDPNAKTLEVEFSDGSSLIGTAEHPVYVGDKGWVRVDMLLWGDIILHERVSKRTSRCQTHQLKLDLMEGYIGGILMLLTKVNKGITSVLRVMGLNTFTERCGRSTMVKYLKGFTSTILTGIGSIMTSATSNVLAQKNMASVMLLGAPTSNVSISLESDRWLQIGTGLKKVGNGIGKMASVLGVNGLLKRLATVSIVRKTLLLSPGMLSFVQKVVMKKTGTTIVDMIIKFLVRFVERAFGRINIDRDQPHAPVYVVRVTESKERPVYNLHVDGPHEFYANGVLVHNCVWGFTELFPGIAKKAEAEWHPPKVHRQQRSASRYDKRRY